MAGIGFVLRRLMDQDNINSKFRAYYFAVFASAGIWLATVFSLAMIYYFGGSFIPLLTLDLFRGSILYNFAFSLPFAAPVCTIATRYLSDAIYEREVKYGASALLGALATALVPSTVVSSLFYLIYPKLTLQEKWLSIVNFQLIVMLWVGAIFISALKQYRGVSWVFIAGLSISVFAALYLESSMQVSGLLLGYNIGLGMALALLIGMIFAEYPHFFGRPLIFFPYFKKYKELAIGSFFFNSGIWVDKWIMWFAPEASKLPSDLIYYPNYDSAMFIAYLTVIPAMALFLIHQETDFFSLYVKFYQNVLKESPLRKIEALALELRGTVFYHGRNLMFLQAAVASASLLLAPWIFNLLNMNMIQIGIFRNGVLGSVFLILVLFICVILSYFEARKGAMKVQILFCFLNIILTLLTLALGFPYYGFGFFLASLITFVYAATELEVFLREIPYHSFITNNQSIS